MESSCKIKSNAAGVVAVDPAVQQDLLARYYDSPTNDPIPNSPPTSPRGYHLPASASGGGFTRLSGNTRKHHRHQQQKVHFQLSLKQRVAAAISSTTAASSRAFHPRGRIRSTVAMPAASNYPKTVTRLPSYQEEDEDQEEEEEVRESRLDEKQTVGGYINKPMRSSSTTTTTSTMRTSSNGSSSGDHDHPRCDASNCSHSSPSSSGLRDTVPLMTGEEAVDLDEEDLYDRSLHLVERTIHHYREFVRKKRRRVDVSRWQYVAKKNQLHLYKEKVDFEALVQCQSMHEPGCRCISDAQQAEQDYEQEHGSFDEFDQPRDSDESEPKMNLWSVMGGGVLQGDLHEFMYGLSANNVEDLQVISAIQHPQLRGCDIVQIFDSMDDNATTGAPTYDPTCDDNVKQDQNYEFHGVKWLSMAAPSAAEADGDVDSNAKDKPQKEHVEEMCYIERTGMYQRPTTSSYGYRLLKSVQLSPRTSSSSSASSEDDDEDNVHEMQRHFSLCYIFKQVAPDQVEVFFRGILEFPLQHHLYHLQRKQLQQLHSISISDFLLSVGKARKCAQMKRIARLILDSKEKRAEKLICRCSAVVKGLPKSELCSGCRAKSVENKLLTIRNISRQNSMASVSFGPRALSSISRRTHEDWLKSASRISTVTAQGNGGHDENDRDNDSMLFSALHVRPRAKTLTKDDDEVISLRMTTAIHDDIAHAKPFRAIREDNILMRMLEHYENARRQLEADLRAIDE